MADSFWVPNRVLRGAPPEASVNIGQPPIAWRVRGAGHPSRDGYSIECLGVEGAQNHVAEWMDLASRSLEPNVFYEPSFALSAARHISGTTRPDFLFVWENGGGETDVRLVGVWPLVSQRSLFGGTVKTWVHDYCCSGAPLLDRAQARPVIEQIFKWLGDRYPNIHSLAFPRIDKSGPIFALLRQFASERRRPLSIVTQHDRAALDAAAEGVKSVDLIATKKKKELLRQFRRLSELGRLSFGVAEQGADLRDRIEAFMALESMGWKGRRGGAFLIDARRATFLRAMTRGMGLEGKCRVYWLAFDGRMVAGHIVLLSGNTAYFWKTAYDEGLGFASPGVLLTLDMTDRLLGETGVLSADSCAVADHPMIDQIWRGRLRVADVMVSLRGDAGKSFSTAVHREQFRLRLRQKAKSILAQFRSA